jgi:DNA-binding CsgD family transcriptional regulator
MKTTQGVSSSHRNSKRLREGIQVTSLSPREEEILRFVTRGLTNKEIAVSLNIAIPTVNQFVNRLFLKTGVHNRTQLAVLAVQGYETREAAANKNNKQELEEGSPRSLRGRQRRA